jgi:hypothetical protein
MKEKSRALSTIKSMLLRLFYIYAIYTILQVCGFQMYQSRYRCTRDIFDYYDRIGHYLHRHYLPRHSLEKHTWSKLPDHVSTCEVPYYKAYCISTPFNYLFRLPTISNHYSSIKRITRVEITGLSPGSYTTNRTHPSVKFDILCIPNTKRTMSSINKKNRRVTRFVSKKLSRREL